MIKISYRNSWTVSIGAAAMCRCEISLRTITPEHSLLFVLNSMHSFTIRFWCDWPSRLHEVKQNHTLLIPEHSCHVLLWNWLCLNFFGLGKQETPLHGCFISELLCRTYISSPETICKKNHLAFYENCSKKQVQKPFGGLCEQLSTSLAPIVHTVYNSLGSQ